MAQSQPLREEGDPSSSSSEPESLPQDAAERRAVFRRYFERYYRIVVGYFRRQGVPIEEARELAQDVYVSGWSSFEHFRGDAHPTSWLLAIARNRFKNYLRRRRTLKRDVPEVSLEGVLEQRGSLPRADAAEPTEPAALRSVLDQEEKVLLAEGIRALPPRMRECLRLALGDEMTYREIGEVLGIAENTVKSLTFQARQKLDQYVREHAPELSLQPSDPGAKARKGSPT